MKREALAEAQLRCYLTVLLKGPAALLRTTAGREKFIEVAEVVAVSDFSIDEATEGDPTGTWRPMAESAPKIAANDDLFHCLFG